MRRPFLVFVIVVVATLGLDQASKALVRSMLPPGGSVAVVPNWFYLTHVRNEGAAFGLLQGRQPFFVLVTFIVLTAIAVFWVRSRNRVRPAAVVISIALITGGAIGNLIDRVISNRVTDFLDAAIINFPVFNVADSAIVCGTALLVVWLLFGAQDLPPVDSPSGSGTNAESDDEPIDAPRSADGPDPRIPA